VPTKKEKKAAREAAKAAARAQAQYRNEHRADRLPVGVSMVVLDKDFAAIARTYVAVQASSCSTGQVLMTRATGTPHSCARVHP